MYILRMKYMSIQLTAVLHSIRLYELSCIVVTLILSYSLTIAVLHCSGLLPCSKLAQGLICDINSFRLFLVVRCNHGSRSIFDVLLFGSPWHDVLQEGSYTTSTARRSLFGRYWFLTEMLNRSTLRLRVICSRLSTELS